PHQVPVHDGIFREEEGEGGDRPRVGDDTPVAARPDEEPRLVVILEEKVPRGLFEEIRALPQVKQVII
ncbi:MAG: hypothetical protein LUQ67_02450, partial [Methanomicrobiales archaeon]|nr:hypothetical protein [Methanomicrobiales archaeon]